MYFGLPQAMIEDDNMRKAYYAGIRIVAEYLRLEEGGTWESNVRADFDDAFNESAYA